MKLGMCIGSNVYNMHVQHLGRYLECQGMTLKQNRVRPITLLNLKSEFKVISQKWSPCQDDVSRALFGLLPWRSRSQHDLEAKSCPTNNFFIQSLFKNYITKMIAILRRRVAHNIWVATLKVKVTVWPWSKIVSGPYFHYFKSDFKTISQKWSPYWDDV